MQPFPLPLQSVPDLLQLQDFCFAPAYPTLTPYTGAMPGIKAFVAAVFGGIGSIPGAMVGGILLGIIEIFGKAYISSSGCRCNRICSSDRRASCKTYLVLFGKNIQEKV